MKKINLILFAIIMLSLNYSCTKEFVPNKKSKVVVVRSKAYPDIEYKYNTNYFTIKPDLSKIFRDIEEAEYYYYAKAYGTDAEGGQLGEEITWNNNLSLETDTTMVELGTDTDYFYLYIINSGSKNYGPITINYGNSDAKTENILFPNNGALYRVGYYKTHYNTSIKFYDNNNNSNYFIATAGDDFDFPNTDNQCVVLTINAKGKIKTSYKKPKNTSFLPILKH